MKSILLISILFLSILQDKGFTSPDGSFSVSLNTNELSDSQHHYIMQLTDKRSGHSVEIANCITKDLPPPNLYWDKDSRFLIFEQSNDSFDKSAIKILNLKTRNIEIELSGLIGNNDRELQQYDSDNEIILYFKFSHTKQMPRLCSYELKSKKISVLLNFDTKFEMDFPTIKRTSGKRELTVSYSDVISGNHTKQIKY